MRTNMGLKRVQIMIFDWQDEPFKKMCEKGGLSFCEGMRRVISREILSPMKPDIDLHFKARKRLEE